MYSTWHVPLTWNFLISVGNSLCCPTTHYPAVQPQNQLATWMHLGMWEAQMSIESYWKLLDTWTYHLCSIWQVYNSVECNYL